MEREPPKIIDVEYEVVRGSEVDLPRREPLFQPGGLWRMAAAAALISIIIAAKAWWRGHFSG